MHSPCFECLNRYGYSYTEECDNKCAYAKEIKEYKESLERAAIEFSKICSDGCPCQIGCEVVFHEDCINRIIDWLKPKGNI